VAAAKLAWWRTEVAAIFDGGRPRHPVAQALAAVAGPYGITRERLGEIIDGMEMDLRRVRYADFAALDRYCYLVAGVVGLLAAGIFGYANPRTLDYAKALGTAFQLTNIIRDVGDDARMDRIYLPADELTRFGVAPADILNRRPSEAFARLMAFQVERAEAHYERALSLLPADDRRAQRPGLVMAAIYRTLLDEIRRDGYRVLEHRVGLTPLRKLWIAWKTWITA
jgi:phytoene synthase